MAHYTPKNWFSLIFLFHRSDTFRVLLPLMILLGLLTGGLVYLEFHSYLEVTPSTSFHQIVGFVLSMLLVFRVNSAYDRWWEGRKLWGALVNNSRSLAAKCVTFLPEQIKEERELIVKMLILFPSLLRDHLRKNRSDSQHANLPHAQMDKVMRAPHRPLALYAEILSSFEGLKSRGFLTEEQLLRINPEVFSLIDITGACERIKGSRIPISYSLFLKKIIFVFTITMPFPFSAQFGYWGVPAVMILFYAFASIELVSEEVEEPFGFDSNDLPIDVLVDKIAKDLSHFLQGERAV
jgi:putative membrane protein